MLPPGIPEYTLGWAVLNWGSRVLAQPDDNPTSIAGERWRYSPEQAKNILWMYAVNPVTGRYIYKSSVLERGKKWGKSPFLAAILCTEFLGPVELAGWTFKEDPETGLRKPVWHRVDDERGQPIGIIRNQSWVQIAAVSVEQTANTMDCVRGMLTKGSAYEEYPGLDVGIERCSWNGSKLERIAASAFSREGNRPDFVGIDETHLWVPSRSGPDNFRAIQRNLAPRRKRWMAATNAPVRGQGSVAEIHHDAYDDMISGRTEIDNSILMDTRQVSLSDIYDKEKAYPALEFVYGDAYTTGRLDIDSIWEEIMSPMSEEAEMRRFYFNQMNKGESTWLKLSDWDGCHDPRIHLKNSDPVALGFRVTPRQSANIVACRLTDMALFDLSRGSWERHESFPKDWEVPMSEVDIRMRKIIDSLDVKHVCADPQYCDDIVSRWVSSYPRKKIEGMWSNQNQTKFSRAVEQFEAAVQDGRIKWKDGVINRHVQNCHIEEVSNGHIIRKETPKSENYITAAQAAVLAAEAARLAIADGALKKNKVWTFS